jgi:hypothetical protein
MEENHKYDGLYMSYKEILGNMTYGYKLHHFSIYTITKNEEIFSGHLELIIEQILRSNNYKKWFYEDFKKLRKEHNELYKKRFMNHLVTFMNSFSKKDFFEEFYSDQETIEGKNNKFEFDYLLPHIKSYILDNCSKQIRIKYVPTLE